MTTLAATRRTEKGKSLARKARAESKLPAVMYGKDVAPISVTIDPKQLTDIFNQTRDKNTVVQVDVDGTTYDALVREVQRHPVSREILHVDFFCPRKEDLVEVMVPLETFGKPAGAILGGRIRMIRRGVKVRCTYDKIPKSFQVDVSHMNIGDMVKASEVPTPEGVEIVIDNDFNVITLYGKRVSAKRDKK